MGVKAKLKRSSPKVLNAWLLFVTILVIVFSFLYYSFVFVKNNEKGQIENRFIVLAQIGKNVMDRKKGFEFISETALKRVKKLKKITRKVEKLNEPENATDQKNQEKATDKLKELRILIQKEIKKANECLMVDQRDKEDKKEQKVSFQRNRLILGTWEINGKNKDENTVCKEIYIYVNVNDFFKPLQRTDVFDGLLIIQEEKNIPGNSEEKKKTSEFVGNLLYHTFQRNIDISDLEKLKNSQHGIESGCLREIEISKITYKLFLQPLRLDDGEKWYVGGLAADKKFRKEARKLMAGVIIPFLILFFIFLLSIPILKLFLMSKFEQLNTNDIVLTTISINFGTIALLLLFVFTFQVISDTGEVQKHLQDLAKGIKTNFTEELPKAYQELNCFESSEFLLNYTPDWGNNFEDILSKSSPGGRSYNNGYQIPYPAIYPFFKGVFWMDETGQQILQFSTRNYGGDLINVENRKYFQEAGNWRVPEAEEPGSKFMLESITSKTSGENLAAISIKSNLNLLRKSLRFAVLNLPLGITGMNLLPKEYAVDFPAAAMTTQLTSVIDTIMPVGYGFCIIDKTGKVWFHSNSRQNLQENFISEVENDKALLSAISSNREKHLVLDYQDKKHKCFFMPVPDIPLYILTFHDLRYTSAVQVTIILHIVLFFITLALFIGLLFITEAWCNYRKSLLKRKYIPFEWFRPLRKNKDTYQHLILSNLVIVVFLILFKIIARTLPFETFFLCLSALLYSFVYNYYTITGEDAEKYRLNKIKLLIFFLVFIFLVDLTAVLLLDKFILLFGFQVGLYILLVLAKLSRSKFKPFEFLHSGHVRNWIRSYVLFLLSWLLVVGVVPVILYYFDVHSYEKEVALKHFQVKLAEEIENRDFEIEEFYSKKISNPDNPLVMKTKSSRKESGIYANIIGDTNIKYTPDDFEKLPNTFDDSIFNKFAGILTLPLKEVTIEQRAFVFPTASDKSFTWKKKDNKLILKYQKKRFPFANKINNNDDLYMYVESTKYSKISLGFLLLLFAAAIFLLLVYFLIRFAARMVFGVNLPGIDNIKRTNTEALDEITDSIIAGSHVIIYCPSTIEMKCCENALIKNLSGKLKSKKIDHIDLKSGSRTLAKITKSSKERLIIIKNFEMHLNDTQKYLNNMKQVASLLRSRNFRVVVLMSRPLEEIIEFYEEKLNEASSKEASPSEKEMQSKYKEIIDGLNEINEGFLPMYIPLKTMDEDKSKNQSVNSIIKNEQAVGMQDLIKKEFQAAEHFKNIAPGVSRYYDYLQKKNVPFTEAREEMIIKIQELMQQYYNELLSSCSKKEKYILYDIAQDMFVNVSNLEAINTLLKKGLLVYDGEFKLMNESFRNYILCSIDADELNQYVRTLYPKWMSYKAPLLFIAFSVAVLLAFQGDLLSKVDALVATALGGVAIITKFSTVFFGYFKSSSK